MISMKTKTTLAAAAALFALSGAVDVSHAAAKTIHCYGVNSCKGTSDCKSGAHACKGQNDCKGQGFKAESAKKCAADGGKTSE